jgi:hypothetical protein
VVSGHIIINSTRKPPALLFAFRSDQNMPRAPHAARGARFGAQEENFWIPRTANRQAAEPRGDKTGPGSGRGVSLLVRVCKG